MEEIGCHFKFEQFIGNRYHDTDLLLSSGRNCLRFIIRERNIHTLFLPYFLCESLGEVSKKENINIRYYHVNDELLPMISEDKLDDDTYIYIVNYYGLLKNKMNSLIRQYQNVIVDNTHDFFNKEFYGADTIYNYRKYFGVPDGGCVVSKDLKWNFQYPIGKSLNKVIEMLSRDETGEYFHYPNFLEADKYFQNEELVAMSNFTKNYLSAIDYDSILQTRLKNSELLDLYLSRYNLLEFDRQGINYMYPFLVPDGERLRTYLKEKNIYSVELWPNVLWNGASESEIARAKNMVLLPIDQRYSLENMDYIIKNINGFFSTCGQDYKILKKAFKS